MNGRRLLIIEWLDHSEGKGWVELAAVEADPIHVRTIGWLIKETDDVYVLAPNYNIQNGEPYQVFGEVTILKRVVDSVTDMAPARRRKV